jgi:hypothetical protein
VKHAGCRRAHVEGLKIENISGFLSKKIKLNKNALKSHTYVKLNRL